MHTPNPHAYYIVWWYFSPRRYYFPSRHIIPQTAFALTEQTVFRLSLKYLNLYSLFSSNRQKDGEPSHKDCLGPVSSLYLTYQKETNSVLGSPAESTQQDAPPILTPCGTAGLILGRMMTIKLIPSWVFIKANNQERYIWFINRENFQQSQKAAQVRKVTAS